MSLTHVFICVSQDDDEDEKDKGETGADGAAKTKKKKKKKKKAAEEGAGQVTTSENTQTQTQSAQMDTVILLIFNVKINQSCSVVNHSLLYGYMAVCTLIYYRMRLTCIVQ